MNIEAYGSGQETEPGLLDIVISILIGATGAPTLNTKYNRGILSIVRNSTGNYTLNLKEGVVDIVKIDLSVQSASYAAAGEGEVVIPISRTPGGSTPGMVFITSDWAGAATDPDNGAEIFGTITVKLTNA